MENSKDATNKFYLFSRYGTQVDWNVVDWNVPLIIRIIVISSEGFMLNDQSNLIDPIWKIECWHCSEWDSVYTQLNLN